LPPALADLEHQRVRGEERVGDLIEWAGTEVGDLGVEFGGHGRDLCVAEPGDAEGLDQLLHPPSGDPEQIAGGDHRGQRAFGPAAALEQPVREVGPGPQFGDDNIQGAGAGVELAVAVAVADVDPVRARLTVGRAADRVGLGGHQSVDERGQHLPQQIRRRSRQLIVQETGRVDTARSGHRVSRFLKHCGWSREDHAVAALHAYATPLTRACRTPP
jgi:hypothetical protein